jgi:hypothetical protein
MPKKPFLPPPVSESETERVRNVPALHAFISAVEETLASGDEDAFWRCESFFRAFCQSGFERELINYELRRMTESGAYSTLGGTGLKLMIASRPRYSLLFILSNPSEAADTVYSTMPEHRMLAVLGPAALELCLFKQRPEVRNEVFDPSAALLPDGDLALGPGDVATFVAGQDVIGRRYCGAPTLTVLFGSDIRQSVRWEYDPATLLPLRALASSIYGAAVYASGWGVYASGIAADARSPRAFRALDCTAVDYGDRSDRGRGSRTRGCSRSTSPHSQCRHPCAGEAGRVRSINGRGRGMRFLWL